MKIIGIGLDHSNICKNYNTVYLDRDNTDPATMACMTKVLKWYDAFLSDFVEAFGYDMYRLNQNATLNLNEIVKKRFFFYSLEKEIIAQTFIFQKEAVAHENLEAWLQNAEDSLLAQNDEEGEGVNFFCNENSQVHKWLIKRLSDCTLDDVPFNIA